jgi:hypothetical protein
VLKNVECNNLRSPELAVPEHYAVACGGGYLVAKGNSIQSRNCKFHAAESLANNSKSKQPNKR